MPQKLMKTNFFNEDYWIKNWYFIFIIIFLLLLFGLGSWGLTDSSEARYAEISREMIISKDYLNPTLLGIKHFHKPPVTYYLTALGFKLFGINEFGARFFLQVALLFQLFFIFKITDFLYNNKKISLAASLIYFTFPIVIISTRNLTTDAYLTTFILAATFFWLSYIKKNKTIYLYLFYAFLGVIFETKGPVGLIVPITFIMFYKSVNKLGFKWSINHFLGILLFLIVGMSWYVGVILENKNLLDYFIGNQIVNRVASNNFNRSEPFWYYLALLPLAGFPLILFLIKDTFKNYSVFLKQKSTEFVLLFSVIIFVVILSVSSSKLILYTLPVFPFLAILLANYFDTVQIKEIKTVNKVYYLLLVMLILGMFIIYLLNENYRISLDFIGLTIVMISLSVFLIQNSFQNSNYLKPVLLGTVFMLAVTNISNFEFKENELKLNSVKPIASYIAQESKNNKPTVIVFNQLLPSLEFYLNEPIITVNNGNYRTERETLFETNNTWKEHLINFKGDDKNELLQSSFKSNSFLIIKKNEKRNPDIDGVIKGFSKAKQFDKYIVYSK